MPDPRLDLTAQELIYAATALRAEARRSSERGTDPQYGSTQAVFCEAARRTADLAEKVQRIAEQVAHPSIRGMSAPSPQATGQPHPPRR